MRAARDGTVLYAADDISAYGQMVIIKHDNGFATCYAHNSRLLVDVNDRVRRGDAITLSGDGGRAGQPALHFQLRRGKQGIDPLPYLP